MEQEHQGGVVMILSRLFVAQFAGYTRTRTTDSSPHSREEQGMGWDDDDDEMNKRGKRPGDKG